MKLRYLAIATVACIFLMGAVWINVSQNSVKLALAPEISATKVERGSGVLGFTDKKLIDLGTVVSQKDYTVALTDPKIINLPEGSKAIEYILIFNLTGLNADDTKLDEFVNVRLGTNYLNLFDEDGKSYPMQDLGSLPVKTVRFLINNPSKAFSVDYQSNEMKVTGSTAISWKTK
jgi:hypothetical protein